MKLLFIYKDLGYKWENNIIFYNLCKLGTLY